MLKEHVKAQEQRVKINESIHFRTNSAWVLAAELGVQLETLQLIQQEVFIDLFRTLANYQDFISSYYM